MRARLLCLLTWLCIVVPIAAEDPPPLLAAAVGLDQLLGLMPESIRRQVAASAITNELDALAQETLLTRVQSALPVEQIRAELQTRLAAADISDRHQQVSAALAAPAIGKISKLLNMPADAESLQTLQSYRARLASQPPVASRLAAVDRLLVADGRLQFAALVQTAIVDCTAAALAESAGSGKQATMFDGEFAERRRGEIHDALQDLGRDYHLYALRHQDTELLNDYVTAWQTPALQRLLGIVGDELQSALRCRQGPAEEN
jgi:hypothetical protein